MKESTLLAMKNRLNDLTRGEQFTMGKLQELELILSSIIKLVEKLPGYEAAKTELQKENEELLKKAQDESEELSE